MRQQDALPCPFARRFARCGAFAVVLASTACGGGVAALANDPLRILLDSAENRGVDPATAVEHHHLVATFGARDCDVLRRDLVDVELNGHPGVVSEQGGSADDGSYGCVAPEVRVSFDRLLDEADPEQPADARLVVRDGSGEVVVVLGGLIARRGFTLDPASLSAAPGEQALLSWSPAGEEPLGALAALRVGPSSFALGPSGAPGEPPALSPMALDVSADAPPGEHRVEVASRYAVPIASCLGVASCDVDTQHLESAPFTVRAP